MTEKSIKESGEVLIEKLKASASFIKANQNRSSQRVSENSVVLFNPAEPLISVDMHGFISNNTHYTDREIVSNNEVRFSIRSTLSHAGVPVDELIPQFFVTRENSDPILSSKKAEELFPLTNPDGLRYRLENQRLVF